MSPWVSSLHPKTSKPFGDSTHALAAALSLGSISQLQPQKPTCQVLKTAKLARCRLTTINSRRSQQPAKQCRQLVREKLQEALSADLRAQRLSAVTDQEKRPGLLDFFRGRRAGYGWSCPLRNDIQIKSASLQFVCAIR